MRHHDVNGNTLNPHALPKPDPDPNPNPNPYPNPDLHLNPSNPAGAMLLECEGDDAALAELGITSRLAVNKLRSSLRALAARR